MRTPIEIVTRSLVDPDFIHTRKRIDHSNKSDKIWLDRHIHWAATHAFSVNVAPVPVTTATVG